MQGRPAADPRGGSPAGQVPQTDGVRCSLHPVDRDPATSLFATGLDSPRGLAFGPDGYLYVAEGGSGGTATTVGECRQIPGPVGPYTGGMTARISKVGPDRTRSTFAEGLPSSQSTAATGGTVSGVADVAFVSGIAHALVSGAGCSHGLPGTANGVYRIHPDGRAELVANLSAYRASTVVANPDLDDDEYDGTWYSMVEAEGVLYSVEPNHGDLVRIGPERVDRVVDISASQGHVVPTALAYDPEAGAIYVGNLGRLPAAPGSSKIIRVDRDRAVTEWATGLTMTLALAFDPEGNLYALENTVWSEPTGPRPNAGRIVRIGRDRTLEPVATGLMHPTGMTFGPDGALYVSIFGLGPAGAGSIVRIEL